MSHTRAQFILRGTLAVGATYGAGAVAPFVENAFAAVPQSDLTVVQFALGLEQLETAFYKAALARAGLSGGARDFGSAGTRDERGHERGRGKGEAPHSASSNQNKPTVPGPA